MTTYTITETTIPLQDSTDEAHTVRIEHEDGAFVLTFTFGKLYSVKTENK